MNNSHTLATPTDSRAPCPALNALANHGYVHRTGRGITFFPLLNALTNVYNISVPLALALAIPAFLIYAKLDRGNSICPWNWAVVLDLASLSRIGPYTIAHYASLVHPNSPSHAPDPELLQSVVAYASERDGLGIEELALLRAKHEHVLRLNSLRMSALHEQIALGESGLSWLVMRYGADKIPVHAVKEWFGEERLPDGWWSHGRPRKTIGLIEARSNANKVQKEMKAARIEFTDEDHQSEM